MNKRKDPKSCRRICASCYWYDPRYRDGWCDYNSVEVSETEYCDNYDFMV